ncbi:MAG: nicotinamide-nucleotide amidohydrolase family protein, partial [Planctomycetota bacterium]|nr:nicotinamide-nucleotide amidohydrolase family protein [Planctomycetota bacterium]
TVKVEAPAGDDGERLVEARLSDLRSRFGSRVFGADGADLATVVGEALIAAARPVAVAESCTGGLVARKLVAVPGISAVFREGFVTYADEAKTARLGVAPDLLREHGAVSAPVAEAMARGAAERAGARLAVATTGIAGPGGGSPAKPVGLVWFAVARDGAVRAQRRTFPPRGRRVVQEWAALTALDLLRSALEQGRDA